MPAIPIRAFLATTSASPGDCSGISDKKSAEQRVIRAVNTAKQMLYMPTSRREKYEARAVIDTICVRFGDVLQALVIYTSLNILHILPRQMVWFIVPVLIILVLLAYVLGRHYAALRVSAPTE